MQPINTQLGDNLFGRIASYDNYPLTGQPLQPRMHGLVDDLAVSDFIIVLIVFCIFMFAIF
jgi:hypothetical protein